MSRVNDLHRQAMEWVDAALVARRLGQEEDARAHFAAAFALERDAAGLVAGDMTAEPSRAVLHRSAAALALECEDFREAARLVAVALAGGPPPAILAELRGLLEEIGRRRPLDVGTVLPPAESDAGALS